MPSTYEMVASAILPLQIAAGIVCAYFVHEFLRGKCDPPDDPDGFA